MTTLAELAFTLEMEREHAKQCAVRDYLPAYPRQLRPYQALTADQLQQRWINERRNNERK